MSEEPQNANRPKNENILRNESFDQLQPIKNENNIQPKSEVNIDYINNILLKKLSHSILVTNRIDFYGNAIPLGSFCFAISFILYGLYECKIHKTEDSLLYTTILLFGGVGQITAGFFEFIKSRTYPCALYLLYGLYFLSFYLGQYFEKTIFTEKNQRIFFGSWACLCFPIYIASFKTNIFLSIQNLSMVGFFIVKCIGACYDIPALNGIVSGILELVAGFSSLYICFGQILNQHYKFHLFPAIPFMQDNEIDEIR